MGFTRMLQKHKNTNFGFCPQRRLSRLFLTGFSSWHSVLSKTLFLLFFLLNSSFVLANSSCDDIPGKQNHKPLEMSEGVVCFVEQPAGDDPKVNEGLWTVVYFISHGRKPVLIGGELKNEDGTAGRIVDAFLLDVNHDGKDEVIVIQSITAHEPSADADSDYSGVFYFVSVYDKTDTGLSHNDRMTKWFGFGYSWLSNDNITYKFPYQTKQSIQQALKSPFVPLLVRDENMPVVVKKKSYLYDQSAGYYKSEKYLIAGDKATVSGHMGGWCVVDYSGGKEPLQKFMLCDDLKLDIAK